MTVEQLIQELKKFPKDTPVKVNCDDPEIRFVEEYYDGDSANPHCKIIQAVTIERKHLL